MNAYPLEYFIILIIITDLLYKIKEQIKWKVWLKDSYNFIS